MASDDRQEVEALIARIARGDQAAFAALYDVTSGKLLGICVRVLDERSAAEEAMQEAYVKVWNHAHRYRVTGHSPMTWLITIARNAAIDRLRARRGDTDLSDLEDRLAAPGPTPEEAALQASEARRILDCLDELDRDRRDAVVGAYLRGRSYSDLSGQFGAPLNTMRTWLRRGLASLRECLSR